MQEAQAFTSAGTEPSFVPGMYLYAPSMAMSVELMGGGGAATNTPRLSRKIDKGRLKTKVCRYYQRGLQCPFATTCAFAHGKVNNNNTPAARDGDETNTATASDGLSDVDMASSDSRYPGPGGDAVPPPPPPPSYTATVAMMVMGGGVGGAEAAEAMPPAYPTRYRHNPYCYSGIQWFE